MISFKKLSIEDKDWAEGLLRGAQRQGCEYSFSCAMMWSGVYQLTAGEVAGFLVMRSDYWGRPAYLFPAGRGDLRQAICLLADQSRSERVPLAFYSLLPEDIQKLDQLFPGAFSYRSIPDAWEYLYETQSLITLSGKKLHGKRNHINRFIESYPDWRFEEISSPSQLEECQKMNARWLERNPDKGSSLLYESQAVEIAFRYFFEFGLRGGLIRTGGEVVAYSMGEPLGDDTFDVRIEKAYPDIQGAYTIINREFARHFCEGYRYINREDDAGDEGLRRAKLSYRPCKMVEKYSAVLQDDALLLG